MVELRKRPQRDPPAAAPATKRSKAKATSTPVAAAATTTEPTAAESSTATAPTGVLGKAKRVASKVKEVITGPLETGGDSAATESAARQPSVLDEPESVAVESGETGLIPETAGTAPSMTTVPGSEVAGGESSAGGAAATVPAATAVEGRKGRSKGKNVAVGVSAAAPVSASSAPVEAMTGTGDSGTATAVPNTTTTEGRAIRGKAKNLGLAGSSTAASSTAATTSTPAPAATTSAEPATEESLPPATEDLENPPETGKIDTSPTTVTATTSAPATLPLSSSSIGHQIPSLSTFGGPLILHNSTTSTTFATLLSQSTTGIIIFTYPRASTPGCTTQACSFRDNHESFTAAGYSVYGLSTDSVKANSGFAGKQGLQYELICDSGAVLTGVLGMKKGGNAKGTLRGVVVVDKGGLVRAWMQGGPGGTVDAVKGFLKGEGGGEG